ncbi:MAG: DUF2628 domain-containing protein [Armatimonadota bacterium]|nr:DUF2628 domain-containing protein [Armatimonadota bacterium]MDR7464833.1 DUF2628 domain-containing protein [Armatimonadota bacterium]MDR7470775.1 DUF2628 domain-containing protein [Armatimonadota bacterium]MDR7540332.1 DUF2628 domain-containing protein [Armatimonadota bacterium]
MRWGVAALLVLLVVVLLGRLEVTFWRVFAALLVVLYAFLWVGYAPFRPARWVRRALSQEVPLPARADPADLYYQPPPRRLGWNWAAAVLGPFWYLLRGLWVHAVILLSLVFVSGGLFIPLVWLYAALKADEDLQEFRIAGKSVY